MSKKYRIITFILVLVMLVSAVPQVPCVQAEELIASGSCGASTTYQLTLDGTLTISGVGAIENENWNSYKDQIVAVVIEEGVTKIPQACFMFYTNLVSVDIADTVTEIMDMAFHNCSKIREVVIPKNVTYLFSAFRDCTSLERVTFMSGTITGDPGGFAGCTNLKTIKVYGSTLNFHWTDMTLETVYGYAGGTLEMMADSEGIEFIPIDEKMSESNDECSWTSSIGVWDYYDDYVDNGIEYINYASKNNNDEVTAEVSSYKDEAVGELAIDGNPYTKWRSEYTDSAYITIDLGAIYSVKKIGVWWSNSTSANYQLKVSTDGIDYKDIINVKCEWQIRQDEIEFTSVKEIRYVKLYSTERNDKDYGNSIYEIGVYAKQVLEEETTEETGSLEEETTKETETGILQEETTNESDEGTWKRAIVDEEFMGEYNPAAMWTNLGAWEYYVYKSPSLSDLPPEIYIKGGKKQNDLEIKTSTELNGWVMNLRTQVETEPGAIYRYTIHINSTASSGDCDVSLEPVRWEKYEYSISEGEIIVSEFFEASDYYQNINVWFENVPEGAELSITSFEITKVDIGEEKLVESGVANENIVYRITEDGTLYISGTGEVSNGDWSEYKDEIVSLVIEEGITKIGEWAFSGYNNLTSVDISDSVWEIDNGAFSQCNSLKEFEFPRYVSYISGVLSECTSLETVTLYGAQFAGEMETFRGCTNLKNLIIYDDSIGGLLSWVSSIETVYGFSGGNLEYVAEMEHIEFVSIDETIRKSYDEVDVSTLSGGKKHYRSYVDDGVRYINYANMFFNAKSSIECSTEQEEYDELKAVDGTRSTCWSTGNNEMFEFLIDLGDVYSIDKMAIWWERQHIGKYQIQTSTDGVLFNELIEIDGEWNKRLDEIDLKTEKSVRYIKVQSPEKIFNKGDYSTISEIGVYGRQVTNEENPDDSENIVWKPTVLSDSLTEDYPTITWENLGAWSYYINGYYRSEKNKPVISVRGGKTQGDVGIKSESDYDVSQWKMQLKTTVFTIPGVKYRYTIDIDSNQTASYSFKPDCNYEAKNKASEGIFSGTFVAEGYDVDMFLDLTKVPEGTELNVVSFEVVECTDEKETTSGAEVTTTGATNNETTSSGIMNNETTSGNVVNGETTSSGATNNETTSGGTANNETTSGGATNTETTSSGTANNETTSGGATNTETTNSGAVNDQTVSSGETTVNAEETTLSGMETAGTQNTLTGQTKTVSKPKLKKIVEKNYHSVKIRWKGSKNAKKYVVYRATKKKGKYKKVATTTKKYYVDKKVKAGKKYYYKVKALGEGNVAASSKIKAIKVKGKPSKPSISVKANGSYWQVKWGILKDNSKAIEIYMKTDKGKYKKYTLINTTKNIKKSKKKKGATGIQSSINGLEKGVTYRFRARTYAIVKGKKVYSKWSKEKKFTRK